MTTSQEHVTRSFLPGCNLLASSHGASYTCLLLPRQNGLKSIFRQSSSSWLHQRITSFTLCVLAQTFKRDQQKGVGGDKETCIVFHTLLFPHLFLPGYMLERSNLILFTSVKPNALSLSLSPPSPSLFDLKVVGNHRKQAADERVSVVLLAWIAVLEL